MTKPVGGLTTPISVALAGFGACGGLALSQNAH
jgi:hypothetical protein